MSAAMRPIHFTWPQGARLLGAALLLSLAGACSTTVLAPWEPRPGPYDRLDDELLRQLPAIRAALDDARPERAMELLAAALEAAPQSLHLASLLQDAQLLELELGGRLPALEADFELAALSPDPNALEGGPRDTLRRWYALRAQRGGTARELVLAARIEDDELSALRLLDEALALDPSNVWAQFGRAHVLLRLERIEEAGAALERAIELDPGHPRVRRLEPVLLALASERRLARRALIEWLERTAADPRVSAPERIDGLLELSGLELTLELFEPALERLDDFRGATPAQEFRRQLSRSVALEALGRYRPALAAARAAREQSPASFRSWVHEALLFEHRLGDPAAALDAWRRAAELAAERSSSGLGGEAALLGLQARVAVERLSASLEPNASPAGAPRP